MRFLPLLLLAGCFDGATTVATIDLRAGTSHVVQQLHNAWPDEVGCNDAGTQGPASNEACVAGVRARLEQGKEQLVQGGATVARTGIVLNEGELDLVYDYTAPVGAATLRDQGLSILWMDQRSPRQVAAGKAGKRRVAVVAMTGGTNKNDVVVDGKYRRLTGTADGDQFDVWLLRGREVTVRSEWTYMPGENDAKSPGAWLKERPGLEEALRASGLVVTP